MGKFKLIASDLDGTLLLDHAQELKEEQISLIRALLNQGYLFFAASGRQYPNIRRLFGPLKDRIGYICENGSMAVYKEETIVKRFIGRKLGLTLMEEILKEEGAELLLSGEQTSYVIPKKREYLEWLSQVVKNVVTEVCTPGDVTEAFLKISVFYPKGIPADREAYFRDKYGQILYIADSGGGWLDFMPQGANKGEALKAVAEKLDIRPEEILVFGDGENDIDMLLLTEYSYAMDSAPKKVIEAASYTCRRVEPVLKALLI